MGGVVEVAIAVGSVENAHPCRIWSVKRRLCMQAMGRGGGTICCQAELNERKEESHPAQGEHDPLVGVEVLHGCEVVIGLLMMGER